MSNYVELAKACRNSVSTGEAVVFRDFLTDAPKWNDFFKLMDVRYNESVELRPSQTPITERPVNDVIFRGLVYISIILWNNDDELNEGYQTLLSSLREAMGDDKIGPANAILTLARDHTALTQIHSDPMHTFYLQCEGKSTWHLYESREHCIHCVQHNSEASASIEVGPGDLLFLPEGTFHTIEVTEPRASVVMRQEHSDLLPDRAEPNPKKINELKLA